MVNAVTDIQEDTLVEVVISAQQLGEEDIEIRPHSLSVHSYKTPTFCHFCGELLMGLFKQGLKCEGCGLNFHKRCVFKIPNDCSYKKKRRGSFTSFSSGSSSLTPSSSVPGTGASISDGVFLIPPTRDGSVSPSTAKKERSTSMIAGTLIPLFIGLPAIFETHCQQFLPTYIHTRQASNIFKYFIRICTLVYFILVSSACISLHFLSKRLWRIQFTSTPKKVLLYFNVVLPLSPSTLWWFSLISCSRNAMKWKRKISEWNRSVCNAMGTFLSDCSNVSSDEIHTSSKLMEYISRNDTGFHLRNT